MKYIKVMTALLLSATLSAALCAGCGSSGDKAEETGEAEETSENDGTNEEANEAGNTETSGQGLSETDSATASASDASASAATSGFSYADMTNLQFEYSSGAGAWSTDLTINADGSFQGQYHDTDMGVTGDDYPNGTYYFCSFTGKFGDLTKVDDLTYTTEITELNYDHEIDTTEIIDGMKYIYSEAYGLDNAKAIYFYLPGSKTADLPKEYVEWVNTALFDFENNTTSDTLTFTGLYNENAQEGFSSYDLTGDDTVVTADASGANAASGTVADASAASVAPAYGLTSDGYVYDENYDQTLEDTISNAATQTDMNQAATDRFNYWDGILNDEWSVLKTVLSSDEFEQLRTEQRAWIKTKEQAMEDAGAEYEGGSIQSMVEAETGADLTKERCAELKAIIDAHQ